MKDFLVSVLLGIVGILYTLFIVVSCIAISIFIGPFILIVELLDFIDDCRARRQRKG